MSTGKTILIAASLALVAYKVYDFVANRVGVRIKKYGIPVPRSGWKFEVPITLEFRNPTPLAISFDKVLVNAYVWVNGAYQHIASDNRQITIQPGNHAIEVKPTLSLGTVIANALDLVVNITATKKIFLRTTVDATYAGIDLPTQTFDDSIDL